MRNKKRKDDARRANGQGTLEKKPNGVYLARWMKNGKKFSRSTGTTKREEAEKILASFVRPFQETDENAVIEKLKAEIRIMERKLKERDDKLPALKISDALDAYFSDVNVRKVSAGTRKLYGEMMRRLQRYIEERGGKSIVELREVSPALVKSYLKELKSIFKGVTYNRYLTFYKMLWRTLYKEARLTCNPWMEYRKQLEDIESRRNLTIEETIKVIGSLEGQWKLLFVIGAYTGLRLTDCCHLDWQSVNMSSKRLFVVALKTKSRKRLPIQIPMHPDLYTMLSMIPKEERHGLVVPECASAYDRHSINHKLKMIFERCGIETNKVGENGKKSCVVGFHSLRSGFVTLAAEAGIPFPVIQEIVGHASTKMTEHYFRTKKQNLEECVNVLPSVLNPTGTIGRMSIFGNDLLSRPLPPVPNTVGDFKMVS